MIYHLQGTITAKNGLLVVIDVNGVGYGVLAPMSTILKLPEIGTQIFLYTYLVIKEDSQALYGFLDAPEKLLFGELIKISGFGPKLALVILSHLTIEQLVHCVSLKDINKLVSLPGVGQKTAERLMIELQAKFNNKKFMELLVIKDINNINNFINQDILIETEEALLALGYKAKEASNAVKEVSSNISGDISREQLIKLTLKRLAKACI